MPTKRSRRTRNRVEDMPDWAYRLREHGDVPSRGTPGHSAYVGWKFFGELVPGLPDADSKEGRALFHAH